MTENGTEKEVVRVIPNCKHALGRMKVWCEQGACPICLTAQAGTDWSMLEATRASLRESWQEIKRLKAIVNEGSILLSDYLRSYGGDSCHMDLERWVLRARETADGKRTEATDNG